MVAIQGPFGDVPGEDDGDLIDGLERLMRNRLGHEARDVRRGQHVGQLREPGVGRLSGARPTSKAAPASRPDVKASSSARSSTRPPREAFTKKLEAFMRRNAAASIRFSVSSV